MSPQVGRRSALRLGFAAAFVGAAAACAGPLASPAPAPSGAPRPRQVGPFPPGTPPPETPPSEVPPSAPRAPAVEVVRADTGRAEVALTFHGAGEIRLARQVLDLLRVHGVAATVLAVGTWLDHYPDASRAVLDGGHELGNHTWSHPELARLDEAGIRREVERCRDRLVASTGSPGTFFRPSSTQHASAVMLRLAGAAGYPRVLSYDVDSRDWADPGPAAVRRTVATAGRGSVVSMHLGHPGTLAALPGILDDLAARGLTAVSASRLFEPAAG